MPRPPDEDRARDKNFVVRLLADEREELDRIAERERLTASDVIRQLIRTHAGAGAGDTPLAERLGGFTVVHDLDANESIMRLDGVLPMPIGSVVELRDGDDATVERVRLLTPGEPGEVWYLCLDVRRPKANKSKAASNVRSLASRRKR